MVSFLTCILSVFSYLIPLCYFLPFKLKLWQKIVFFILLYANILLILNVLGNIGVIILLLSSCLYIALINSNRLFNICIFISTYLFCVLLENIFSLIWNILGSPISKLKDKNILYILYIFLYLIALNIICPIIARITRRFLKKFGLHISKDLLKLIVLNLIVCLFIFLFNIIIGEYIGYSSRIITFNSILFGCYFVISAILIANIMKEHIEKMNFEIKQDSYEKLQSYTKQIENMYSSLRDFKHDYSNIMLSMSCYIDDEDMTGLKDYFYEKIFPLNKNLFANNTHMNQLMNIKIIELKSIVSAKLLYAKEIGIDTKVEIVEEIVEVFMDSIDLARILGIFLDNAIEATLETSDPKLQFAIVKESKEVIFIICNTFLNQHIPYTTLKKPLSSTKGANRGLGLYNAHTIVEQYSNAFLDTEISDINFTQRLFVTTVPSISD